jgi:hypothetical protein
MVAAAIPVAVVPINFLRDKLLIFLFSKKYPEK